MVRGELSFTECGTDIVFSSAASWGTGNIIDFRIGDSIWITITNDQLIAINRKFEQYLSQLKEGGFINGTNADKHGNYRHDGD